MARSTATGWISARNSLKTHARDITYGIKHQDDVMTKADAKLNDVSGYGIRRVRVTVIVERIPAAKSRRRKGR